MKDFVDKVCVVTGAGSGIGRALTLELVRRGAVVAASDVDGEAAAETLRLSRRRATGSASYALDVSDRAAVLAHADQVSRELGPASLVVNNAGVGLVAGIDEMAWDQLDWLLSINLGGVVNGTKAFWPQLLKRHGHLVNVSSVFGFVGIPRQSAYNAAKFGVRGFTEGLRQEVRAQGLPVTVSCVHPGGIRTNIARNARGGPSFDQPTDVERFDKVARTTPEQAARAIVRGVERDRARILVGADARAFSLAGRLYPQDALIAVLRRLGLD